MYTFDTGKINGILYNKANPILTTCGNTIRIRFVGDTVAFIETDLSNCLTSTGEAFASMAAFITEWNLNFTGEVTA